MDDIARSEVTATLARSEGISEVVVLLGDARIEYIVWADDPSDAATSILQVLSQRFGLKLCEWEHFYRVTDTAAVAHVFALACGAASDNDADDVDSLAELGAAWQHARKAGTTGRLLDALFTKAFALADQARVNALRPGMTVSNAIAAEAKSFQKKLLAERVQPAAAVLRVRVEDICRHELEAFERSLPAMNSPQKDTMTELRVRVTKRIASEVEHELKGLKQTAAQQNMAETAQRLLTHGLLRDAINRSQS
jgi:glutamyl-tRNA reductase